MRYVASKETLKKRSDTMKRKIASGEIIMKKGKDHPRWKGGRFKTKEGYVWKKFKGIHIKANDSGYVPEHILVMEKKIGRRLLKNELVHHIDGDKSNNKANNLMKFDSVSEHKEFHYKMELLGLRVFALIWKGFA